jgi:hypothetical protein
MRLHVCVCVCGREKEMSSVYMRVCVPAVICVRLPVRWSQPEVFLKPLKRLTRQMLHHTASSSFLIQSYLSTILMYSAFYTVIFRLDAGSWADVYDSVCVHVGEEVEVPTCILCVCVCVCIWMLCMRVCVCVRVSACV